MSAHTPGPWTYGFDSCNTCKGEWYIVGPPTGSHSPFTNEADARLIAAAPDLLVACRMALNDRMYWEWPAIADALKAAITKAEGQ